MIARFTVAVPLDIVVPEGVPFNLYAWEEDGYRIVVHPPVKTDVPRTGPEPSSLKLDGEPAFLANGLTIDFYKATQADFDRTPKSTAPRGADNTGAGDPPLSLAIKSANSFLTRLRHVTRASQISLLPDNTVPWRFRYLNDDGSELTTQPGVFRGRFGTGVSFSYVSIDKAIWETVNSLPSDFQPPVWDGLRLDALAALPRVGTAIVLAATALEVFIQSTLDRLADGSSVPHDLWKWIHNRAYTNQEPGAADQFDVLLHVLTGHSLKEDQKLWESFINLKSARNAFVHEGVAKIGKTEVDAKKASELVHRVSDVINWVRERLPESARWVEFDIKAKVEVQHMLLPASRSAAP